MADAKPKLDLNLLTLEMQLYIASRYNLDDAEVMVVFAGALGDSVAIASNGDPDHEFQTTLEAAILQARESAAFRRANPMPTLPAEVH